MSQMDKGWVGMTHDSSLVRGGEDFRVDIKADSKWDYRRDYRGAIRIRASGSIKLSDGPVSGINW